MVVEDEGILIRRRVLYFGSAVPTETSSGIDSIQKPLRERYCVEDANVQGIDSYITVYPTGLKLNYINDPETCILFPISSLKLCAAVRCIDTINSTTGEKVPSFISLNNPASGGPNVKRPAIFTAITRRTKGRKVLECHGFICATPNDALELVKATSSADSARKGIPNGHLSSYTALQRSEGITNGPNIRLAAGEPINKGGVAAEFYDRAPDQGYFYKGRNTIIKTYNVEKVPHAEPKVPPKPQPAEHKSAPPSTAGGPTPRRVVPLRLLQPGRFMSPPPTGRQMGFFGGPPPLGDPYMYMNHAQFYGPHRRRSKRREGSRSASRKSGGSRSHSPKQEKNGEVITNGHNVDSSSEASSRPRTPPRDYPMYRMSRKEQHERMKMMGSEDYADYGMPGMPYFMPPYHTATYTHDHMHPPMPYPYYGYRARSVPPPLDRTDPRVQKKGKSKKGKKGKKGSHAPSDISTDSYAGYGSEFGPGMYDRVFGTAYPGIPRDFRNPRNQFQNEQAFSKSLIAENRKAQSDYPSAYRMNETADGIVERTANEVEDFKLY